MIIHEDALLDFIKQTAEKKLGGFEQTILPVIDTYEDQENTFLSLYKPGKTIFLDGFRTVDPLKILFYMPREKVAPFAQNTKKRIVWGVKACDLEALAVLDAAMLHGDFQDPVFKTWRENTVIVSTDCTEAGPTCHCTLMGGHPYPEKGFDLNLSKVGESYVITSGSEKGEDLLHLMRSTVTITEGGVSLKAEITRNRKKVERQLIKQNKELEREKPYRSLKSSPIRRWEDASATCVGCGACTNVCPTCYCLILNDETRAQKFVKVRSFDSCQWNGYARVAGGSSPRPKMFERFRNRYLCKFQFMKSNFNLYGCTGCGRCTDACAGEIDFRKVVKSINDRVRMEVAG